MSVAMVRRLREPNSQSTQLIIDELLNSPLGRFLSSPAGAFLALRGEELPEEIALAETTEMAVFPAIEEQGDPLEEPTPASAVPSPKLLEHRHRKASLKR